MDYLSLLSFGAEPVAVPVDPVRGQQALRFLHGGWRDAVTAQLSAGWRALQAKVPDQAAAIKLLSDTAAEQANAATLSIFDTMIAYITDNLDKPLFAKEREEGKSVLAEMKQALSDRQGSIDPSSSKAFALLDQILGAAPISAGVSLARKTFVGKIQQGIRSSPVFQSLTNLYYRLDGTARAVATVLLAGAGGAAWVAQNVKVDDGKITLSAPPSFRLPKTGTTLDMGPITFTTRELSALSGKLTQQLGVSGLSATVAAEYKKGNPLYASGGVRYTTYLPQNIRLEASADVSTKFAPSTLTAQAQIEAGKTLGRKQDLDLSVYTQAKIPMKGPTAFEAGAKLTKRFGADAPRKRRANPAVVRRLSGPLPWLRRLFRPKRGDVAVLQPYLDPTPAPPAPPSPSPSPLPTPLPWTPIILGTALLGGLGWWGWRWANPSTPTQKNVSR